MKCPNCEGLTEADNQSCSCGWRASTNRPKQQKLCQWNDHGQICGYPGILANTTNGEGPWYCRAHFARLMDWPAWEAGTYFKPIERVALDKLSPKA